MTEGVPVTIVTPCMGRLSHLKRSLPTWLEHTGFSVVVVDYSCPEGTARWVRELDSPRVRVVRCSAEAQEGVLVFNPSRARNAGAFHVKEGYLLFLDADMMLREGAGAWIARQAGPGTHLGVPYRPGHLSGLAGAIGVPVEAFRSAGGFDEGFEGWSYETHDLKIRLLLEGLSFAPVPFELVESIPHSDAERTRNFIEKNLGVSRDRSISRIDEKLLRMTGRSYRSWVGDPAVRRMLNA